jgi:hypothetical protein
MPTGFAATDFSVIREHGVLVTTLGGPSTEAEDLYLTLQHKEPYTAQDVKLGMNQPYIEFCGQGWSWYGHIVRFELHRDRVHVQMDAEAAERMHNDGLIAVTFELGDRQFGEFREACHETFRGQSYFADVA